MQHLICFNYELTIAVVLQNWNEKLLDLVRGNVYKLYCEKPKEVM